MDKICEDYPNLRRNYARSVFASISINLGPRTVTRKHQDFLNIPFGWCVITAIGDYNYRRGGHLVLWDLKLVIEFPPGSTIFIPSACVSHSNIAVADTEHRYSFTQYTSGGIMRWVACGMQSLADLKRTGDGLSKGPDGIWADGAELLSTWAELKEALHL